VGGERRVAPLLQRPDPLLQGLPADPLRQRVLLLDPQLLAEEVDELLLLHAGRADDVLVLVGELPELVHRHLLEILALHASPLRRARPRLPMAPSPRYVIARARPGVNRAS